MLGVGASPMGCPWTVHNNGRPVLGCIPYYLPATLCGLCILLRSFAIVGVPAPRALAAAGAAYFVADTVGSRDI